MFFFFELAKCSVTIGVFLTFPDDSLDPPTAVTGVLGRTSVDISEQNVPETGEKFDPVEITEADGNKASDEVVTLQSGQKSYV